MREPLAAADALPPLEATLEFRAADGWFALLTLLVVYVAFGILGGLAFDVRARPPTQLAAIGYALLMCIQAAAGGWAVAWRLRRFAARAHGGSMQVFGFRPAPPRQLILGAITGVGFGLLFVHGITQWFPPPPRADGLVSILAQAGPWPFAIVAAGTVCISPLVEELVFRGAMWTGFSGSWPAPVAAAAVTAVFVAAHAPQVGWYPAALLNMAALAFCALAARVRTGSLLPAVLMHSGYNLVLVLQAARQIF